MRLKYAPKMQVFIRCDVQIHKQKSQNTQQMDTIAIFWAQCGRNMHIEMHRNGRVCLGAVQIRTQIWMFSLEIMFIYISTTADNQQIRYVIA